MQNRNKLEIKDGRMQNEQNIHNKSATKFIQIKR